MKKYLLATVMLLLAYSGSHLQAQTTPALALKNVQIHQTDGSVLESATLVWRNGVIEAVGNKVRIPFDAYVIDGGDSLHVYPGFVDGFALWGSPEQPKNPQKADEPGNPPYERAGIQPERSPSQFIVADTSFKLAMKSGFTAAGLGLKGYMLPGKVEAFYLAPEHDEVDLLKNELAMAASFEEAPGGWSRGVYPSTMMGVMAKFRQLMYDAEALKQHIRYYEDNAEMPAPDRDPVLEALFPLVDRSLPIFFEVDDKEHIERMFKLQDEFGFSAVIISGKEAYAKANELKRRNIPVLAGIDFTDMPDWYAKSKKKEDSEDQDTETETETEQKLLSEEEQSYRNKRLEAWKAEVNNIRKLLDAGVQVGFASAGMDLKDWKENLEILTDEGSLTEEEVLKMMTVNTAEILGLERSLGVLKRGKNASFTVYDDTFTAEKVKAHMSVSNGRIYEFKGE